MTTSADPDTLPDFRPTMQGRTQFATPENVKPKLEVPKDQPQANEPAASANKPAQDRK